MSRATLQAGALAYVETVYSGLLPCKVLNVRRGQFSRVADVRLTAKRGPYARGEILANQSVRHVLPRGAVFYRSGIAHVRAFEIVEG